MDENEASIRIPDVYEVTIKFTSLLPNNFNNFLFNYATSGDIYSDARDSIWAHRDSIYTDFANALTSDLEAVKTKSEEIAKTKNDQAQQKQSKSESPGDKTVEVEVEIPGD